MMDSRKYKSLDEREGDSSSAKLQTLFSSIRHRQRHQIPPLFIASVIESSPFSNPASYPTNLSSVEEAHPVSMRPTKINLSDNLVSAADQQHIAGQPEMHHTHRA
jgi:hypothetical protein